MGFIYSFVYSKAGIRNCGVCGVFGLSCGGWQLGTGVDPRSPVPDLSNFWPKMTLNDMELWSGPISAWTLAALTAWSPALLLSINWGAVGRDIPYLPHPWVQTGKASYHF